MLVGMEPLRRIVEVPLGMFHDAELELLGAWIGEEGEAEGLHLLAYSHRTSCSSRPAARPLVVGGAGWVACRICGCGGPCDHRARWGCRPNGHESWEIRCCAQTLERRVECVTRMLL